MYMHPKSKLINAHINDNRAVYLVRGSSAALWICKRVRMALYKSTRNQGWNKHSMQRRSDIRQEQHRDDVESLPFSHDRIDEKFPGWFESLIRRWDARRFKSHLYFNFVFQPLRSHLECHPLDLRQSHIGLFEYPGYTRKIKRGQSEEQDV